jgi:hypothetical protein
MKGELMTITSTKPQLVPVDVDPVELLIKEARQEARRRRLRIVMPLFFAVLVAATIFTIVGHGSTSSASRVTTDPKISVSAVKWPRCQIIEMDPVFARSGVAAGTSYYITRLTAEHASCVVGQVILRGMNMATHRLVGPSFTSTGLVPTKVSHNKSIYLPIGLSDTLNYSPASSCRPSVVTGVTISFANDRRSYEGAYFPFPRPTNICTSRLSITAAPYQQNAS